MCRMKHCNLSHRKQGQSASAQSLFLGSDFRLPKTVVPAHYEIDITPNFEELTFRGNVAIDVDVVEPVSSILINAHQLTIGQVTVERPPPQRPLPVQSASTKSCSAPTSRCRAR
jgi:hypothetical protein